MSLMNENLSKWRVPEDSTHLVDMVSSMSTLSINIRLTLFFSPTSKNIIHFSNDLKSIYFYIIPKIIDNRLHSDFVKKFGEDIKEEDCLEICKYALKVFYKEDI